MMDEATNDAFASNDSLSTDNKMSASAATIEHGPMSYKSVSSTSVWRSDLTCNEASLVSKLALGSITTARESCSILGRDFETHPTIANHFRGLEKRASAFCIELRQELRYQGERLTTLRCQQEDRYSRFQDSAEPFVSKARNILAGILRTLTDEEDNYPNGWESGSRLHLLQYGLCEYRSFLVDESACNFLEDLEEPLREYETLTSTREEAQIRKDLLYSKTSTAILEARLLRYTTLKSKIDSFSDYWLSNSNESSTNKQREAREIADFSMQLPRFSAQYDELHASYLTELIDCQFQIENAQHKIISLREYLALFRKERNRCCHAAGFVEGLSNFTAPFPFMNLPMEIRDEVYSCLLSFDYNIKYPLVRHKFENGMSKKALWSHPLLLTSKQIRYEASERFFKYNSFVLPSLAALPGIKPNPEFQSLIRSLSFSWPSLGSLSCDALRALKSFKGLRFLKIFVNWGQLMTRHENTLDGISAFEFVLDHLKSKILSIEKVELFEIQLHRKEEDLQDKIANQLESETPDFEDVSWGATFVHSTDLQRLEEDYDKTVTTRILHPQTPGSITWNPKKLLTSNWERMNHKKARSDRRRGRPEVPMIGLVGRDVAAMRLGEIRAAVISKRQMRVELVEQVAAEMVMIAMEYQTLASVQVQQGEQVEQQQETQSGVNEESDHNTNLCGRESSDSDSSMSVESADLENFWGSFNSLIDGIEEEEEDSNAEGGSEHNTNGRSLSLLPYGVPDPDTLDAFWMSFSQLYWNYE